MSGRSDAKYATLWFACQTPVLRGQMVYSAGRRLGSSADPLPGVRVLPLEALRVVGRLPMSVAVRHTAVQHGCLGPTLALSEVVTTSSDDEIVTMHDHVHISRGVPKRTWTIA